MRAEIRKVQGVRQRKSWSVVLFCILPSINCTHHIKLVWFYHFDPTCKICKQMHKLTKYMHLQLHVHKIVFVCLCNRWCGWFCVLICIYVRAHIDFLCLWQSTSTAWRRSTRSFIHNCSSIFIQTF